MNTINLCAYIGESLPPLFECSPAPREGVRVRTPLLYPDGSTVDVFVLERANNYVVTDFGEALGWLRMQSVGNQRSQGQNVILGDVCRTLGLELYHGQLTLHLGSECSLGEAVLRVAQGVVRVSDLWFTQRIRNLPTTADEIDDWLVSKQISFDRSVKYSGYSGRNWNVDYRTQATGRTSLVFLLSTGSRGAARQITQRVLASCVDLRHLVSNQPHLAFVSLFDDTRDVWRQEDFALMELHSEVALWSRPDEFEDILTSQEPLSYMLRSSSPLIDF